MEEWRKIPGYSRYEISSIGRVRNTLGKILKPYKRIIRGNRENYYWGVKLVSDAWLKNDYKNRFRHEIVHRLVLMAFVGMPEDGQVGCHRNDQKLDNAVENLYWGTLKENTQDIIRLGNFKFIEPKYGEQHPFCKYSDELIKNIRNEYTGKHGDQTRLAKKYGMRQGYIHYIVSGKIRTHSTKECYH